MIPAAVKTRPIQSLFQWIESPKNYSEESEWDPTKIVIIVKIHDLWDNNKCFTNSSYLLWCVVRQSDHRMSLHKLFLYSHFSNFHQKPIDLAVHFIREDFSSPLKMKNCPEWNVIVIQSAKQIDYLVDLKFYSVPSSRSNRLDFKSSSFQGFEIVSDLQNYKNLHSKRNCRF